MNTAELGRKDWLRFFNTPSLSGGVRLVFMKLFHPAGGSLKTMARLIKSAFSDAI